MPGATPKLLPFPLVTDPLYQGASAIQALAEALDFTRIPLLSGDTFTTASLLSAYPLGLSLISVSSAQAAAGGWPTGSSGHILTIKTTSSRAAQYFYRNAASAVGAFYRQLVSDPGPHTAWIGATGHYGEYVGTVTLNTAASPTAPVVLTFPAGRFTTAPRLLLSVNSTAWIPGNNGLTAASATIAARHYSNTAGSGSLTVYVHAIQHASDTADG